MANNLKKIIISILFLISGIVFSSPLIGNPLNKISKEDKEDLTILFQTLMLDNYFAYTLFGNKPMTHFGKCNEIYYEFLFCPRSEDLFFKQWKIWKKYESQIEMPNFAFLEFKFPFSTSIFLINKKNILEICSKYIDIFKNEIENEITPEKILERIINSKDLFYEFGENQIIYGILFGFGKTNSIEFHKKQELGYFFLESVHFHDEPRYPLYRIPLPYFMVFKSNDEVFELRKNYEKERKKIIDIYSKGDFLEITLKKLTGPS